MFQIKARSRFFLALKIVVVNRVTTDAIVVKKIDRQSVGLDGIEIEIGFQIVLH